MTWVRVESAAGVRYAAPSFAPPPTIEGFSRLVDAPQRVRSFHCIDPRNGAEHAVLLTRATLAGDLGEVSLAVGGEDTTPQALETLRDAVLAVLVGSSAFLHTNLCGVQLLLNALCTRSTYEDDKNTHSVFAEDDGFSTFVLTSDKTSFGDVAHNGNRGSFDVPCCDAATAAADRCNHSLRGEYGRVMTGMRTRQLVTPWRQTLLYFLQHNAVPVSLLACRVMARAAPSSHIAKSVPSYAAWQRSKRLQCRSCISHEGSNGEASTSALHRHAFWHHLTLDAELSCTAALRSLLHTLHTVYPEHEQLFCEAVWDKEDRAALVMALSPSGLLFASASFYRVLRHTDRLLLCALAVDQLTRHTRTQDGDGDVPFCVHFAFGWPGLGGSAMEIVAWCIGDALCYILGLTRSPDTPAAAGHGADAHKALDMSALSTYLGQGEDDTSLSTAVQDMLRPLQLIATHATAAGDAAFFDALADLTCAQRDGAAASHARHCDGCDAASVADTAPSLPSAPPLLLLSSEGAVVDVQNTTAGPAATAATTMAAASAGRSRIADDTTLSRLVISPPHARGLHRLLGCVPFCVGRRRRDTVDADRSLPHNSATSQGGTTEMATLAQRVAAVASAGQRRALEAWQKASPQASSSRHTTHLATFAIDDDDESATRWLTEWTAKGGCEANDGGMPRALGRLYAAALVTRGELQSFRAIDETRLHSCFWLQRAARDAAAEDGAGTAQYVVGIFRPQVQYRSDGAAAPAVAGATRSESSVSPMLVLHDAPAVLRLSAGHYPLRETRNAQTHPRRRVGLHKIHRDTVVAGGGATHRGAQITSTYCYYTQVSVLPLSLLTCVVPYQTLAATSTGARTMAVASPQQLGDACAQNDVARYAAGTLPGNAYATSSEVLTSFYRLYMHRLRTQSNARHVSPVSKVKNAHCSVPIEEVLTMVGDAVEHEKEVFEAMWHRSSDGLQGDAQPSSPPPLRVVCEELICCQEAAHAIFDSLHSAF